MRYLLPLLCSIALLGCRQAATCDDLSTTIAGTWTATWRTDQAPVTFQADGTLLDPNDALLGRQLNGYSYSKKNYEIRANNNLYLRAEDPMDSSNYESITVPVSYFDCNALEYDYFFQDKRRLER